MYVSDERVAELIEVRLNEGNDKLLLKFCVNDASKAVKKLKNEKHLEQVRLKIRCFDMR